ncbi:MAG TPA: sialidase family protein, partial [Actinomycetota bacterium]|nr:sialidase family protein [Actinomycetota bacterium]
MTFIRHRVIAVASIVILSVVVVAALGTGASALTTRTVAPAGHGSPRLVFPLLTPAGPAPTAEVLPGGAIVRHSGDSFEKADEEGYVESLTTGTWAFEPTLGFTESGALFFQGYAVHQGDQEVLFDTLSYPFVLRSGDGGVTWKDVTPMDDLGNPRHELTWDPYLYVDPETSRVFTVDYQPGTCALVSWSDDDGETWTTNRTACGLTDHQNVFAGPAKFSPTVDYPNVVYYCSIGFGLAVLSAGSGCQKSLDGGNSFIPVGSPFVNNPVMHEEGFADIRGFCAGPLAPGAVGPDGTVYVPSGQCGRPWLAIS